MADHEAAVRARLLEHSGVAALVGTRVWLSALPQEPASDNYMPALVVQLVTVDSEYAFGGRVGAAFGPVQIDSWADVGNRSGCQALMEQVESALAEYSGTQSGVTITVVDTLKDGPRWDPDAKLWRGIHTFEFWGSE